jgi:hypothetical protein
MSKANVPTTTLTIIPVRTRSRVVEGFEWEVRCVDGIVEVQPFWGREENGDDVLDSRICVSSLLHETTKRVCQRFWCEVVRTHTAL